MGRYWCDGNIEFLGRIDNQVKINGYRIEIGEIENALNSMEEISDCRIVYDKGNIIAFYRLNNQMMNEEKESIIRRLTNKLPNYMLPSKYMCVDKYPLTENGKISYKDFDEKLLDNIYLPQTIRPLVTDEEKNIARIWEKVLNCPIINADDEFFLKGGDSLKAIRLVNEIKDVFGIVLQLYDVFDNSTVAEMAKEIKRRVNVSENNNEADEEEL